MAMELRLYWQILYMCRLLIISLTFIPTCTQHIPKKCPRYRYQWLQKSKDMCCVEDINGSYHCFLDQNGNLTEVCRIADRISPNEEGCPLFYVTGGRIRIIKPFDPCPANDKECPRQYHRYYYTDELYKYADCIPLESAPSTEPTQTETPPLSCPTSDVRSSKCQCYGVIIASFLVLLWILLLQRKQIMEDFRQIISFRESRNRNCWKKRNSNADQDEEEDADDDVEQRIDTSANESVILVSTLLFKYLYIMRIPIIWSRASLKRYKLSKCAYGAQNKRESSLRLK